MGIQYEIRIGDCLDVLRDLPDGTSHCCVTSPPCYRLRDYRHPDQIGQKPGPDGYVKSRVHVSREGRRVICNAGTLWLNLGNSYTKNKQRHMIPARVASALQSDETHFVTFPPDPIEPYILAGCAEGSRIPDPFGGLGTTVAVAAANWCNALMCEINPRYTNPIEKRVQPIRLRKQGR